MMLNKIYEICLEQFVELLKELYIFICDGKLNQDSCCKLKQVYYLFQFIELLFVGVQVDKGYVMFVDYGVGKLYFGFILYDLFFKQQLGYGMLVFVLYVYGIEICEEFVMCLIEFVVWFGFGGMLFLNLLVVDLIMLL